MAFRTRFDFIGDLIIPKNQENFYTAWKGGKSGSLDLAKIRFGVKESINNSCFVESFGAKYDVIRIGTNPDGTPKEVLRDEITDDVIRSVPYYRQYIADLGEGEQRFITQYDFINYLGEKLPSVTEKVHCSGRFSKTVYKGEVYDNYEVERVWVTTEPNKMQIEMDLFFNRDCIDDTEKDNHRYVINAYIQQYIDKDIGEKFLPQTVIFNASKVYELGNEQAIKWAEFTEKKLLSRGKEVTHIPWKCKLIRGAETVEFDESMLTDAQKEQIAAGVSTIDAFKSTAFGENIYEFRLIQENLSREGFKNGAVDSGFTIEDIEANLFSITPPSQEPDDDFDQIVDSIAQDSVDKTIEDLMGMA